MALILIWVIIFDSADVMALIFMLTGEQMFKKIISVIKSAPRGPLWGVILFNQCNQNQRNHISVIRTISVISGSDNEKACEFFLK